MKSKMLKLKESNHNFVVFAIASAEVDYYLIWNINNILGLDLKRIEHPVLNDKISNGKTVSISCFYSCAENNIEYTFVGNKYGEFILIPQLPNVDFVLKISGILTNNEIKRIGTAIRTVKGITACIDLNIKKTSLSNIFERI
jgi:hypothetical protein